MKRFLPMILATLVIIGAVLCFALPALQDTANDQTAAAEGAADDAADELLTDESTSDDYVIATVNGEELLYSVYYSLESAYISNYEAAGVDVSDESIYTYLQDLAFTYAIEQMLLEQDMVAQNCYDFDEETEAWFVEQGTAAYNAAIESVIEVLRESDPTMSEDELSLYALSYALSLNVTEETYIDYYRDQYAAVNYYNWLLDGTEITEEDVLTAYTTRVAESQALYENDAAAFETDMSNGYEVWYKPAGYRSILQILLPAEGDTEEAKLQSVEATINDIYTRLENGESFQALIAEYGTDTNFDSESFMTTGYQVHQDSVIWEDLFVSTAFSEEMAEPGCWSQPFVSDLGVHILYYLCDSASGAVELNDDVYAALEYAIYVERYTEAQNARLDELAETAEVIIY